MNEFPDGWVTRGFARVNGVWIECGSVPGIAVGPPVDPREWIGVHEMAFVLNAETR